MKATVVSQSSSFSEQYPMHWLISTGDPSADAHMAHTLESLWRMWPHHVKPFPYLSVVAGEHLQNVLARYDMPHTCLATHQHLGALGLGKGMSTVYHHLKLAKHMLAHAKNQPPTLILLVDYGGFHLRLAAKLKQQHPEIPIHYYIPPQLWASRAGRLRMIQRSIDKLYSIFPFEPAMYEAQGVACQYVGHPLQTVLAPYVSLRTGSLDTPAYLEACRHLKLIPPSEASPNERPLWAFLPGSRRGEVVTFWPLFKAGILKYCQENPQASWPCIRVSVANTTLRHVIDLTAFPPALDIDYVEGHHETRTLLALADVGVIKSGTATLEAALLGCPSVIVYKSYWLLATLARFFIRVPFLGLPNLLTYWQTTPPTLTPPKKHWWYALQEACFPQATVSSHRLTPPLFPECLQEAFTPEGWLQALQTLMRDTPSIQAKLKGFQTMFLGQTSPPPSLAEVLCTYAHMNSIDTTLGRGTSYQ
jgi:lipid-A-disaccharide synthase